MANLGAWVLNSCSKIIPEIPPPQWYFFPLPWCNDSTPPNSFCLFPRRIYYKIIFFFATNYILPLSRHNNLFSLCIFKPFIFAPFAFIFLIYLNFFIYLSLFLFHSFLIPGSPFLSFPPKEQWPISSPIQKNRIFQDIYLCFPLVYILPYYFPLSFISSLFVFI